MRKVIACIIALMLIFVLASCGKEEPETTTTNPSYTIDITTTVPTTTTPSYVLTTAQGNTVYWQETTRFEFDTPTTQGTATTANQGSSDYDIDFTVAPISRPDVNTSVVATTAVASDNTTYVPPTTSAVNGATTQSATTASQEVKSVMIDPMIGQRNFECITVDIDATDWTGGIAACSVNVIVSIDGTESETTPTLTVPSKITEADGDRYYECELDLTGLEVTSGTVVTFTIPAGTIKNTSGTVVNQSYSYTHEMM